MTMCTLRAKRPNTRSEFNQCNPWQISNKIISSHEPRGRYWKGGGRWLTASLSLLTMLQHTWSHHSTSVGAARCRSSGAGMQHRRGGLTAPKPLDGIPAACLAQSLQTGRWNPCGLDGIPIRRSTADHRLLVRSCLVPSLGFEPPPQQAVAPPDGWVGLGRMGHG
jgi:hypothetical protein